MSTYPVEPEHNADDGIEEITRDYEGSSSAEEQGAVPAEPPYTNPMPLQDVRKPKGTPRHNM